MGMRSVSDFQLGWLDVTTTTRGGSSLGGSNSGQEQLAGHWGMRNAALRARSSRPRLVFLAPILLVFAALAYYPSVKVLEAIDGLK